MATATATATKGKSKTSVKFRPLDDRLLIEPHEAEETTAGGIVLPDTAREKPQRGTVVAAGPGKLLDSGDRGEMTVRVGMSVLYGKYSGTEITIGGEDYVVLRESDVLGIVE
ncbi:MAG: co-chaperone GroES [Phycisphaerae bacterium]|nr:MAG: co-chaperone GroES [Planctomycetota bacterium]KAB2938767.1 MAG: co-chaperone GroES [Phycisphaerae bacterium]MBE7456726.1 co-chaperone GroES [Planctomycetia bacterium]MCK6463898.1 co-chaperone GroES [Phycisphaerae bacterium]MCL4718110.1 co-chaperone GroES [Phycisphaerae bacterium]